MTTTIRAAAEHEVRYLCDGIADLELWKNLRINSEELQMACSRDPQRSILLAERDGQRLGCIMFRTAGGVEFLSERVFRSGIIYPPSEVDGLDPRELLPGGYVNMLAVFNGNQGRGVGTQLLAAAEQASAVESDRMYLCVSKVNPRGQAFYERHGYSFIAEARDCIRPGNTEHLMQKMLR